MPSVGGGAGGGGAATVTVEVAGGAGTGGVLGAGSATFDGAAEEIGGSAQAGIGADTAGALRWRVCPVAITAAPIAVASASTHAAITAV